MRRSIAFLLGLVLAGLVIAPRLVAQSAEAPSPAWLFRTRAFISGGSHESSPAGYKAYSGLGLEVGLDRRLARRFAIAVTVRTESREVDSIPVVGPSRRQGSLEFLPASVLLQWRPATSKRLQPYVGVGAALTVAWEKSGTLDSLGVSPAVGPALQLGADLRLGPSTVLNADIRWNGQRSSIRYQTAELFRLDIDPLTIGLGLGFRF